MSNWVAVGLSLLHITSPIRASVIPSNHFCHLLLVAQMLFFIVLLLTKCQLKYNNNVLILSLVYTEHIMIGYAKGNCFAGDSMMCLDQVPIHLEDTHNQDRDILHCRSESNCSSCFLVAPAVSEETDYSHFGCSWHCQRMIPDSSYCILGQNDLKILLSGCQSLPISAGLCCSNPHSLACSSMALCCLYKDHFK